MKKISMALTGLLAATLLVVVPPALPSAPFTVRADAAGCLDDKGNPVTCPISLDPNPLPVGKTLAEQELSTLFGTTGGKANVQPMEFTSGSTIGHCMPRIVACGLTNKMRVGSPIPAPGKEIVAPGLPGSMGGDAAITSGDVTGDGRAETMAAARCPGSLNADTGEICLSVYDPASNAYAPARTQWYPSGALADTGDGVGRVRVAEGLLLAASVTITRATFVASDGTDPTTGLPTARGGVIATFTTEDPHGLIPGQPIRFGDDPDLAAAMCPALAEGASVLCGADLSAEWLPILGVPTPTTFTLKIGLAFDEGGTAAAGGDTSSAGPTIPDPWPVLPEVGTLELPVTADAAKIQVLETGDEPTVPFRIFVDNEEMTVTKRSPLGGSAFLYTVTREAGVAHENDPSNPTIVYAACTTCSIGATGVRPGLAMAWEAPGHVATLATYSVRPDRRRPFRLLDEAPIGALATTATSASADGTTLTSAVPGRDALDLAIADYDGDGRAEIATAYAGRDASGDPMGLVRFYAVSEAKQLVPLTNAKPWDPVNGAAPYFVSMASGIFVQSQGSNTAGQDLVLAWGGSAHAFEVFDVTGSFGLNPASLDDTAKGDVVVGSDGKPAKWTSGTTYQVGDIVRDDLGYWRASTAGVAACTTDVDQASKFYFPVTPQATLDHLPAPPISGWALNTNFQHQIEYNLAGSDTPSVGPVRGVLDPSPPFPTKNVIPQRKSVFPANSSTNVLHGQYVSPALAAQTVSGASFRMWMRTAIHTLPLGAAVYPQVIIRAVSNDGTVQRGVLYSTLDDPTPPSTFAYDSETLWTDNSTGTPVIYYAGWPRRFPGTADVFSPLDGRIDLQQGDRLVVEFGSRIAMGANAGDVDESIWAGTPGSADVPMVDSDTTGNKNPFVEFTDPIKIDNCADHLADTSGIAWKPVPVSEAVVTTGPHDITGANLGAYGGSVVRVAAGDFDMDSLDEIVVAETRPDPAVASSPTVPIDVSVWRMSDADCQDPQSPAAFEACPSASGSPDHMLLSPTLQQKVGSANTNAANPVAQLSLGVGRVGAGVERPSFPNDLNPDVVVAYTCTVSNNTCGGLGTSAVPAGPLSGPAVVTGALDVCVVGTDTNNDAVDDICPTPPDGKDLPWALSGLRFSVAPTRVLPAAGNPGAEWTTTAFAMPDVDRDSKTLGTPIEYLETGHVQPLMVLRSPPVHFDAFDTTTLVENEDGSVSHTPGPDGLIDSTEVWDVNNCFANYLATGEDYVCHTTSSYGSSSTVTSTLSGEVSNAGTTSGSGQLSANVGAGNGNCERSDGAIHVADPEEVAGTFPPSFCVEGSAFLKLRGSQEQSASVAQTVGREFTYTSTVTTAAGTDAVYAAVQQNEILEYPVYAGAGFGFGAGDPIEYVTTKTPLRTRFQWTSSEDYNLPLTGEGLDPQNVLSYARSEDQLKGQAPKYRIQSVTPRGGNTWVEADMRDAPSLDCALNNSSNPVDSEPVNIRGTDAWGYLDSTDDKQFAKYPCAADNVGVQIQDTQSTFDRTYTVSQILSDTKLRLEPTTPLPSGAATVAGRGSMFINPGSFPVDEWTVRRFHHLESELVTNTESGYDKSYGWGYGAGLDAGIDVKAAFAGGILGGLTTVGLGLTFDFSTDYTHNELQTMTVGTTQETRFSIEITGDVKPDIAYTVKPYLMQSPTGAMVLDWTTSANLLDTFWHKYYFDAGPNPAFALPHLLTPYKAPAPNSKPDATTPGLLRSPDFGGWDCTKVVDPDTGLVSYTDCVPGVAADPAKPLWLVSTVHNYSLKTYDRSTPLKIRFYAGDPARGGYQIAEGEVPTVRSVECVNRYCLPAQGQSTVRIPWTWNTTNPGLAGRGRPTNPLAIYAIVDPGNTLKGEVHDFSAPVEVRDCAANYPTIDGEFDSSCPTTDNEAWFTQQFDGNPHTPTDLDVTQPGSVIPGANGSVKVSVHAAADTGRVQVRLFKCPVSAPDCLPQTTAVPLGTGTILSIPAGGTASTTFQAGLTSGSWTIWAQVVPVANWEPTGGGPFDVDGSLANNQVKQVISVP